MFLAELFKKKPKGITYEEANQYLERKFEEKDLLENFKFSEKTFKRDREELLEILGIETIYKRSTNTYKVSNTELETETVFDTILLIDAYRQVKGDSEIMIFEKRKSRGLENLNGILHAIQNQKTTTFKYTKHGEGIESKRIAEPYALKEFKNRWYLLANEADGKDFFLKTFGLDRISDLELNSKTFKKQVTDIDDLFKNSFGIISTLGQKPEKIVLSFDYEQGKFVKSLPIHHSQKVLVDNDSEYRIELTLAPTYDFYQELLTHAGRMKIISPENVKAEYFDFINSAKEI